MERRGGKEKRCVISPDNGSKVGLKAQKPLAQGVLDVTYDTPSLILWLSSIR